MYIIVTVSKIRKTKEKRKGFFIFSQTGAGNIGIFTNADIISVFKNADNIGAYKNVDIIDAVFFLMHILRVQVLLTPVIFPYFDPVDNPLPCSSDNG